MDSLKRDLLITIEKIWLKHPEFRLGQIIEPALFDLNEGEYDLFYISNEALLKNLREEYEVK